MLNCNTYSGNFKQLKGEVLLAKLCGTYFRQPVKQPVKETPCIMQPPQNYFQEIYFIV